MTGFSVLTRVFIQKQLDPAISTTINVKHLTYYCCSHSQMKSIEQNIVLMAKLRSFAVPAASKFGAKSHLLLQCMRVSWPMCLRNFLWVSCVGL